MTKTYAALGMISKHFRDDAGLLHFEVSKATGPDLDLDKQIVDAAWAETAMQKWFTTGGNLREQHSNIAAGKALTLETQTDGQYIGGIVVDPISATKVENDVLTGLSIGIKGARVIKDAAAPNGRIVGGEIIEVSLVDRPANPTCKLTMAKAAENGDIEFVEEYTELAAKSEGGEVDGLLLKADDDASAPDLRTVLRTALGDATKTQTFEALLAKAEDAEPDGQVHDPAAIAAVRDGLVNLVIAELQELLTGEDEIWDIAQLFCALRDLMDWWSSEAWDGETSSPAEFASETDTDTGADLTMAAVSEPAVPEPATKTADADLLKAADVSKMINEAVTKATEGLAKAAEMLREELVQVKAMATPGGPARSRSPRQALVAGRLESLQADQAHMRRMAASVTDQALASGYRDKVKEIEAEIGKITQPS